MNSKGSNPGDSLHGIVRPVRVTLSRAKGWRMPANTVKVDRTTKWGNPFVVGEYGSRAACVNAHKHLLAGRMLVVEDPPMDAQIDYLKVVCKSLPELRGKNLACWCPQNAECHADMLLHLANSRDD